MNEPCLIHKYISFNTLYYFLHIRWISVYSFTDGYINLHILEELSSKLLIGIHVMDTGQAADQAAGQAAGQAITQAAEQTAGHAAGQAAGQACLSV